MAKVVRLTTNKAVLERFSVQSYRVQVIVSSCHCFIEDRRRPASQVWLRVSMKLLETPAQLGARKSDQIRLATASTFGARLNSDMLIPQCLSLLQITTALDWLAVYCGSIVTTVLAP